MKNYQNYRKMYDWKKLNNRKWPDREITKAPIWCSVDLRDGNQALPNPMTLEEKVQFFKYLVEIGFKEIEIGFPAASETEYNFTRYLIENNLIPDDVKIQVLTQSREEIIEKTFLALKGAKNAIVHLYNSTSKLQREVVFNKSKEEVKEIAINGAKLMVDYMDKYPETNWYFQYSPESFSTTEIDYAIDVVNSVLEIWFPNLKNKPLINFPATVECSTPNVFADQIEYVSDNIKNREKVIISIHSHNDRGTGVATSELALLAGADRIEGSLLGNGERTGNADIFNIAMNMYVIGVDPELDFSDVVRVRKSYEKYVKMPINPRHPYAGELVFTAFSGSHQDAISKGLKNIKEKENKYWEVPYLPINPADINREYEPIIRINSQSGKGGVAFVLEEYGYVIPKDMRPEIGYYIKSVSDKLERELTTEEIFESFYKEYINRKDNIKLLQYDIQELREEQVKLKVILLIKNEEIEKEAKGSGPVDAFANILKELGYEFSLKHYSQSAIEEDNEKAEKSIAITYIGIKSKDRVIWAIGKSKGIVKSSLKGIISAINRI